MITKNNLNLIKKYIKIITYKIVRTQKLMAQYYKVNKKSNFGYIYIIDYRKL